MLTQIVDFLKERDERDTAKTLLDTMAKYAIRAEEYDNLARWYMETKYYPEAIKYAEKALVNSPTNEGMYACRANLAKLYNHINNPTASLRYSSANLLLQPEDYDAKMEQVFSLFLLNRKAESEQLLRELIVDEDIPEKLKQRVKFNLGTYDLYKGDFQKGLRGFILEGKKLGIWKDINPPFKFWEGGIQFGKTVVIYAEGGIGDEFINIRFWQYLKDLGMEPIWYTNRKELVQIFQRHGIDARSDISNLPSDTLWTYSMALPIYLDVKPSQLWDGPYLFPNDEYVKKWNWIKASSDKPKVGIRWTGNPAYEHDLHREIPLAQVLAALDCDNYKWYSLQRDTGADQVFDYPFITDLQHELSTYEDTLAVISQLDIVITSCTSIAHAAAAQGKKVFVLVPISAYYTWASSLDTSSIWYSDSVVVLRQTVHKSWKEPIEQLTQLLSK